MLSTWVLAVIWLLFLVFIYADFKRKKKEEIQETNKTQSIELEKSPANEEEETNVEDAKEEKILPFIEATLQFFEDERFNFVFKTEEESVQSFKAKLLFKVYFLSDAYWRERLAVLLTVSKNQLIIMPRNGIYSLSRWQFVINDYSRVTVIDLKDFLAQPIHNSAELLLSTFEEKLGGKIGENSKELAMKAAYEIVRFLEWTHDV